MTADEAVDVFWRAVEAGHFADLEARFRPLRWTEAVSSGIADEFRQRVAELLGLDPHSTWVDGLVAQGWAL